jgi:uncharacterized protein (DUF1501 family)
MPKLNRRNFLVGCSTAIATMALGGRLSYVAFGSPEQEPDQEIILVIFLRGGLDGLNVVPPIAGPDRGIYEANRSEIAIPTAGENAAINLDDRFGLHPGAAPLFELYQDKKLAIVHAAGLTSGTRSHFDAMEYMELGTPDSKTIGTGWLTRHLQTAGSLPPEIILPAVAVGNLQPTSLTGSQEAVGMSSPKDFSFNGNWKYESWQRLAMRDMYGGATWLHASGIQTLDAVDILEFSDPGEYTPENGATYPNGGFGNNLKAVAQIIKMQLGMRVATVDLGGWDTHDSQGDDGGGYFANKMAELAQGLNALYTDLNGNATNNGRRLTTVVMSEFGRSLKENGSRGTDHGHGNIMLVLGDSVNGGEVHGTWPGLSVDQLYDRRDLNITTDYRRVLSEILIRRMGNPNLGTIFPGYTGYEPMGVVTGADLPPNYEQVKPTPTPTVDPNATPTPTLPPGGTIPRGTPTPVPTDAPVKPTPTSPAPGTGDDMDKRIYIPVVSK